MTRAEMERVWRLLHDTNRLAEAYLRQKEEAKK